MNTSPIEWTDLTWNPVTGCTKVSPGCQHCYAKAIAHRFAGSSAFPDGFAVTLHPARIGAPLRWRTPSRVFVNSMSDLFHDQVPDEFLVRVFTVMARAGRHTFQVLTKRPRRMRAVLERPTFRLAVLTAARDTDPQRRSPMWPLRNVWLGVSAEDQKRAELRIPVLLDTPAAVRFVSCEPLLGPVDLRRAVYPMGSQRGHGLTASYVHAGGCCERQFHGINWCITGGESGPGARPMHPDWARSLRDQCQHAGVPFFFKQWGRYAPADDAGGGSPPGPLTLIDPHGTSHAPQPGEPVPAGSVLMARAGKKRAGRILDGRAWDGLPAKAEATIRGGEST